MEVVAFLSLLGDVEVRQGRRDICIWCPSPYESFFLLILLSLFN